MPGALEIQTQLYVEPYEDYRSNEMVPRPMVRRTPTGRHEIRCHPLAFISFGRRGVARCGAYGDPGVFRVVAEADRQEQACQGAVFRQVHPPLVHSSYSAALITIAAVPPVMAAGQGAVAGWRGAARNLLERSRIGSPGIS